MKPCYLYMRCSGRGQMNGDTWDRQTVACSDYAKLHDLEIIKPFREEAVSGTQELINRPALQQLLLELEESDIRVVIIEKLDRLARDVIIQETIIKHLTDRGIEIISVAEPDLCSKDPSRVLIRQIFGAIAGYDRAMIVSRARAARERIRASGRRCEGPKPYGWEKDGNGSARMNQAEQDTIALVIRLYAQTKSTLVTAEKLNTLGYKTRRGKGWQAMQVSRILTRSKNSQEAHK
jgi:DNA invertase Pin-like site-specific DNA recombinase